MKLALRVAYDGTDLRGFARQPACRTVQGEIERCLSELLRTPVRTVGAGRTDRGVHASGQVVSLEAPGGTEPEWVMRRLNRRLAPEIAVCAAAAVPAGFDARFSARSRTYEYRLYRGPAPDPFLDRFALHVPGGLDLRAMRAAARALVGERDFASFCRAGGRPTVRRVCSLSIATPAPARVVFRIRADSFCQQMVRSIAGTLLAVGGGARRPEEAGRILAARSRAAAPPVASPKALHFVAVEYRPDPFAPAGRRAPRGRP
ncbi:MAG: tRNA pseudouridine(38-40) synthase TruA [Acidobacteria bacterium]|nr:tRNA pseudouridine(38-40) synthase TruA [Acidobacteriota bacterium]